MATMKRSQVFAYDKDEWFKVDNHIVDVMMPTLSTAEFTLLIFIIRKTKGYQKDSDYISYSQLVGNTALKSDNTVTKAIRGLENRGIILVERGDRNTANLYTINKDYDYEKDPKVDPEKVECLRNCGKKDASYLRNCGKGTSETANTKDIVKDNIKNKKITSANADVDLTSEKITISQKKNTNNKKPATPKKKEEPTEHQEIVDALVKVTGTDMKLKSLAGQLVRHARELRIAGYTAQDILDFGEHWKRNDWRYRQDKQLPSTMTVLRDIGMRKVTQQLEDENFRHYTQEEWDALNNKIVQ